MKARLFHLSRRYRNALRRHLLQRRPASLVAAQGLGSQARDAGLQTLGLARLHEQILISELLPACPARKRATLIKQAGIFFAVAITPIERTHRSTQESTLRLKKSVEALSRRTVELAASNRELSLEIDQRKAVEEKLKKSERHYTLLLEQSGRFQEQLRHLSRQILSAQEDERRKISRELHDVIAQTLTGINVQLASLKKAAAASTHGLDLNIARTQRLVEHSVNLVHRFARELRPAVLDDLGLVSALHSFMKDFFTRTGIRTRLTAFAGVELLDTAQRTALYRVAQEALTNVARHAQASQVQVKLQKLDGAVCMKIEDNGKGMASGVNGKKSKRLGLIGMRERMEMINGVFAVESALGKGTTIEARIPLAGNSSGKRKRATPPPAFSKTRLIL
jgi:signal transduction histidine kinase